MQLRAVGPVLTGKKDHQIPAGGNLHIRQRPLERIFRIVGKIIPEKANGLFGTVVQFHPFAPVAVGVDDAVLVRALRLVDAHRVARVHLRNGERRERLLRIGCAGRGIRGISGSPVRQRNDRQPGGNVRLPGKLRHEHALPVGQIDVRIRAAELERRLDPVGAGIPRQVDDGVFAGAQRALRQLKAQQVGGGIGNIVVVKAHILIGGVVNLHPGFAVSVRLHLRNGERRQVLLDIQIVEPVGDGRGVRRPGRRRPAVAVGAVVTPGVGGVREQGRDVQLLDHFVIGIAQVQGIPVFGNAKPGTDDVRLFHAVVFRGIDDQIFPRANGHLRKGELVQPSHVIGQAVTGKIDVLIRSIVQLNPIRRARRLVDQTPLVAGHHLVDDQARLPAGIGRQQRTGRKHRLYGHKTDKQQDEHRALFHASLHTAAAPSTSLSIISQVASVFLQTVCEPFAVSPSSRRTTLPPCAVSSAQRPSGSFIRSQRP